MMAADSMINPNHPTNPYIMAPIREPQYFFVGRDDLFHFIKVNLELGIQIILLHGQPLIGKSSIIFQIPLKIQLDQFLFISLSLEDNIQETPDEILYNLAQNIKNYVIDMLDLSANQFMVPSKDEFQKNLEVSINNFLFQIYQALGSKNLVLLLDEFDILSNQEENTAVRHFFHYLKSLLSQEKKIFVIPVLGRKLDNIVTLSMLSKAAIYEVNQLRRRDTERLIIEPTKGILEYKSDAIEAILELSAGHPYFTQVICFGLFEQANEQQKWIVERDDVEKIVERAIELSHMGLESIYQGLPMPERIILSAVAEAQKRSNINLWQLLEEYGIIRKESLVNAEKKLLEWQLINSNPTSQVKIDLVRRWLLKRYQLLEVLREDESCQSLINKLTFPQPLRTTKREVFISYAWGGESESIANQVDRAFQEKGITIIRDKRDLEYKGLIKDFMEQIGKGKCIIVIISKKYLESENCMFELVQIAKNNQFYDRTFPVVMEDARIYEPVDRIQYVKYWEQKIRKIEEEMKNVSLQYLRGFWEDIDLYAEIRQYFPQLTSIIRDMNTLTTQIHSESGFDKLFQAVERKLKEDEE